MKIVSIILVVLYLAIAFLNKEDFDQFDKIEKLSKDEKSIFDSISWLKIKEWWTESISWKIDLDFFGFNIASDLSFFDIFLFISIFFIWYIVLLHVIFDVKKFFYRRKIDKLENEVFALKSKLYDDREKELEVFTTEYKEKLDTFSKSQEEFFEKVKNENEAWLEKQKAENDKILDKLNLLDKSFFDKIKESIKK